MLILLISSYLGKNNILQEQSSLFSNFNIMILNCTITDLFKWKQFFPLYIFIPEVKIKNKFVSHSTRINFFFSHITTFYIFMWIISKNETQIAYIEVKKLSKKLQYFPANCCCCWFFFFFLNKNQFQYIWALKFTNMSFVGDQPSLKKYPSDGIF